MKLEDGKRYVLRNGEVTGLLEPCANLPGWFKDLRNTWREDGLWSSADVTGAYDIVAEYVEPQPQHPLRWVENTKLDKPGIWLLLHSDGQIEAFHILQAYLHLYSARTYCYLGPIPEILPPKKKVVERLWLEPIKRTAQNAMEFEEAWFVDGETIQPPGDWIRTDRTREREI